MENMDLMREWVRAEIQYAIESREEDESGHRGSARFERDIADRLFDELKTAAWKVR